MNYKIVINFSDREWLYKRENEQQQKVNMTEKILNLLRS